MLYKIEWARWIMGDWSVPYNSRRILNLKRRDQVPVLSDMVYSYKLEGYLRACSLLATVFTIAGLGTIILWYYESGFRIKSSEEVDRTWAENPMKFDEHYQYLVAFGFAVFLIMAFNFVRRRVILRCYYDTKTDTFTMLTINWLGRIKHFHVKSGMAKEIKTKGLISTFSGNLRVFDANGKSVKKFMVDQESFLLPWYYNRLVGYGTEEAKNEENPLLREYKALGLTENRDFSEARLAEELSKLNAKRLEEMRQSSMN